MKSDLTNGHNRTDEEIAASANNVIQWLTTVPPEDVRVSVHNGWLRLEGELDWWHQKSTLEEVLERLPGLKGINNLITLKTKSEGTKPQNPKQES
jgi:osmotically-inducible protein OsmY